MGCLAFLIIQLVHESVFRKSFLDSGNDQEVLEAVKALVLASDTV